MLTVEKGAIAEAAVYKAFAMLGIPVYLPMADGGVADCVVALSDGLKSVQIKLAHLQDGRITATTTYRIGSKRRGYGTYAGIVDYIAVYCIENDTCYAIKAAECASSLVLRVVPAANGQTVGIKMASDYSFEHIFGPLAQ